MKYSFTMQRRMPWAGWCLAAVGCLLGLIALVPSPRGLATEPPPDEHRLSEDLQVVRLTEDVWRFVSIQDQGSDWGRVAANGLVVVSGASAALIDTPWTDDQTRELFQWVAETLGAKVEVVVPTHSHGDCLGGLAAAHELGARSYGHEKTAELASAAGKTPPQSTFTDRLELSVGNRRLELRHLGAGHTVDNIVVWIPDEKILFGGCLIKSATAKTMGYIDEADLDAWPATLTRVAAEYPDAALIVPGHGRPGGTETLEHTLELITEHRETFDLVGKDE